jgi:hypothetical protein
MLGKGLLMETMKPVILTPVAAAKARPAGWWLGSMGLAGPPKGG